MTLVTLVCLATVLLTTDAVWWHYALFSSLAGVPFAYAIFSNFVMRKMEVKLFSRYRDKLMGQLTDLQEMVYRDELTGLYNRRHFYEVARMEVEKARVSRQPLALVLLDLDGLKLINDEYGHRVGDEVLAGLGRVINTHTRGNDVPARLGGDEFVMVFPGTGLKSAQRVVDRVLRALHIPYEITEISLEMSASVGIAVFPHDGLDTQSLLRHADSAMYVAKAAGGGAAFATGSQQGIRSVQASGNGRASRAVSLRTA